MGGRQGCTPGSGTAGLGCWLPAWGTGPHSPACPCPHALAFPTPVGLEWLPGTPHQGCSSPSPLAELGSCKPLRASEARVLVQPPSLGHSSALAILPAPTAPEPGRFPVPGPAGSSPRQPGGQGCAAHPLAPALPGLDKLWSLPKPSRQGFPFPPSTSPRKPGSSAEPMGGVKAGFPGRAGARLQVTDRSQTESAGAAPWPGTPDHPVPAQVLLEHP